MAEAVRIGPFAYSPPRDGVAVVEFDNPPVNALAPETYRALSDLVTQLEKDAAVRVIVFVSANEKVFAAGADLKKFEPSTFTPGPIAERVDRAHSTFLRLQWLSKPTIAAIEGHALGGGCEFALAMDFRFMSRGRPRFGLPEASLGLIPAAGGTQRLSRLVGRSVAAEMLMLGKRLDADEAERHGLLTAAKDARGAAVERAAALAAMPSNSLRAIKAALNEGYEADLVLGLTAERRAALEAFTAPEAAEGVSAFLDRRTPHFHD